MRAIQNGNVFRIYDDSMQTFNQLPTQAYTVCFDQNSGFFLRKYSDIRVNEKIYGVHIAKVNKVLSAFADFQRNLGVILSGDKGIGKSLFSKILSCEAIKAGIPLLIVNNYIPGISSYLNDIEQEVVVLFDEFDKTFSSKGGDTSPQTEMLTLFDGISQGKKLFVVTCNDLNGLNNYLVNRPGRFHYHIRFEYPSGTEIREYMQDKLSEAYWGEIDKVINFSKKINLNYDCLRSIAFELNRGDTFEVAIQDLNILNLSRERYNITVLLDNGVRLKRRDIYLDMFDDSEVCLTFEDPDTGWDLFGVTFVPADNKWDTEIGLCVIREEDLSVDIEEYVKNPDKDDTRAQTLHDKYANVNVKYITFQRERAKDIHYAV